MAKQGLPKVVADLPLAPAVEGLLAGRVEWLPWEALDADAAREAEGLFTYGHPRVDGAVLDRLPVVRVISNYGVGVDHIDLAAAQARGVPVGNTPGILDGATADLAMALLLAAARRLVEGDRYARGPEFTQYDPGWMLGREVHGQTLGIVGLGRIGAQVARRARGFDLRVLYHNRRPRPDLEAALGVHYRPLNALLEEADFVVLTCPLSAETRGLIGREALGRMKSTAYLVNVARGAVVDLAALTEALAAGRIAGAALDVTDPEPLPRDHPILRQANLTITPHLGSATEQTRQKMAELSVENLLCGLAGQPLRHRVGEAGAGR